MSTPCLEARDLAVVRGGIRILSLPSLTVCQGEVLALIGPNGAGKSTLLRALAGIEPPTSGTLRFQGEEVRWGDNLSYRRRVTMAFQEPLLFDTDVFANVAAGLRFRKWERSRVEARVGEMLERFRISHLASRSARNLSGGEAQRASLARALAVAPEVLFLDEPFAALDPPTREALLDDLERTLRETGTTALFATHDRDEALRLADRLAVMMDGRIAQAGTPAEVLNQPADEAVAAFVGMETLLEGVVARKGQGTVAVVVKGGATIEALGEAEPAEKVRLGVRPENVTISLFSSLGGTTSARNNFPAIVTRLIPRGALFRVQLDCGFPLAAHVTMSSAQEMGLVEGSQVTASLKATAIHLLRKVPAL